MYGLSQVLSFLIPARLNQLTETLGQILLEGEEEEQEGEEEQEEEQEEGKEEEEDGEVEEEEELPL